MTRQLRFWNVILSLFLIIQRVNSQVPPVSVPPPVAVPPPPVAVPPPPVAVPPPPVAVPPPPVAVPPPPVTVPPPPVAVPPPPGVIPTPPGAVPPPPGAIPPPPAVVPAPPGAVPPTPPVSPTPTGVPPPPGVPPSPVVPPPGMPPPPGVPPPPGMQPPSVPIPPPAPPLAPGTDPMISIFLMFLNFVNQILAALFNTLLTIIQSNMSRPPMPPPMMGTQTLSMFPSQYIGIQPYSLPINAGYGYISGRKLNGATLHGLSSLQEIIALLESTKEKGCLQLAICIIKNSLPRLQNYAVEEGRYVMRAVQNAIAAMQVAAYAIDKIGMINNERGSNCYFRFQNTCPTIHQLPWLRDV